MKIYRLENSLGAGPFAIDISKAHESLRIHEGPQSNRVNSDALKEMRYKRGQNFLEWWFPDVDLVFGWSDISYTKGFIKKTVRAKKFVEKTGLIWNVYDVPDEHVEVFPDGQCVFYRSKATSVEYDFKGID